MLSLAIHHFVIPDPDGIEVLKKIGTKVKIVVVSAVKHGKIIDQAKELGAVDYIKKPYEADEVLAIVKKVLS